MVSPGRRPVWHRLHQAKDPSASVTIPFHSNDFQTELMGLGRSYLLIVLRTDSSTESLHAELAARSPYP